MTHGTRLQRPCVLVEARDAARIVVDPQEVDRLTNEGEILRWPFRPRLAEYFAHLLWISTQEHGIEVLAIHVRFGSSRRGKIGGIVGGLILRLDVDHEADLIAPRVAICLHSRAVCA